MRRSDNLRKLSLKLAMEGEIDRRKIESLTKRSKKLQQKAFLLHREGVKLGRRASLSYSQVRPCLKDRLNSREKIKIAKNMMNEAVKLTEAVERLKHLNDFDRWFFKTIINYEKFYNSLINNVKF